MTRIKEHRLALGLRKKGMSYSQIKNKLGLSKSTLSDWLRKYPLSKEQIRLLRDNNEVRIEKFRRTMQIKKNRRLTSFYNRERKRLLPISQKELFLAGLFLYWGEGNKSLKGSLSLNNTDPQVMKFYLFWLRYVLGIPKRMIKVYLHLYDDMDVKKEIEFWSNELSISLNHFTKPYIKKSKRMDIDQKGFGHGTCGLIVNNVRLKEKIMMGLRAIADFYTGKPQFML